MSTLGSLFDGSGGFPLAGALSGITPLWASEIEPYPIAVTTSRFPQMKHLGNVAEVDGRKIPPVDIITFGSPCQDMSVAGKRVGMKHREKGDDVTTRSGLFYEAIRIIREMREATNGRYPTFAIWENVPGAFSSNGGEDFRCVLEEFAKICGGCAIPRPANGKWRHAGEIVGDGFSIAWRLLDAQYWGVPQRRKRIYLVADFAGGRAGKILFERESVLGNPAQGGAQREGAADHAAGGAGGSGGIECLNPLDCQSKRIYQPDGICPTLPAMDCGGANNQAVLYEPRSAMDENWAESDVKNALRANASKSSNVVCYALDSLHSNSMKSSNPHSGFHAEPVAKTLQAGGVDPTCNQGGNVIVEPVYALQGNGIDRADTADFNGCGWREDVCYTLNTIDRPAISFKPGQGAKARTLGESETSAPTLASEAGGNAVPGVVYAFDCRNMRANNGLSATLQAKTNGGQSLNFQNPVVYSSGAFGTLSEGVGTIGTGTRATNEMIAVYEILKAYQGRKCEGIVYPHVTGALCANSHPDSYTGQDAFNDMLPVVLVDKQPRKYIVRRLTPLECCRLQGFPDGWGVPKHKDAMDDCEAAFWEDVRRTYAEIAGKTYKPFATRAALVKWYNGLHTDSAEYKMWGNGVALPCAYNVVSGCAEELRRIFHADAG